MQLIKLIYIAHGWHLGLTGNPLITEPIQAWKHGPVVESIYHAFKHYGFSPIPKTAEVAYADLQNKDLISPFLDRVWDSYSKYTGGQLSTITHKPNTPWHKTYKAGVNGLVIENSVIEAHYKELADAKRAAKAA